MQAGRSSECRVPVVLPLQRVLPAFNPGNASVGCTTRRLGASRLCRLLRRSQRSPLFPAPLWFIQPRKSLVDSSGSKARPSKPDREAPVLGGVPCRREPSGRGCRDFGRGARLLFAAAGRARPDQPGPWPQAGLDREPPHSDAGDGGSRSRAAARYSSVASRHGAGALAPTESTRSTHFPEEL